MDSVSNTLADSILFEVDRRSCNRTPTARGCGGQPGPRINNWLGVCAGTILTACESLAAQGHPGPRPAHGHSADSPVLDKAFTASGECDEGVGY